MLIFLSLQYFLQTTLLFYKFRIYIYVFFLLCVIPFLRHRLVVASLLHCLLASSPPCISPPRVVASSLRHLLALSPVRHRAHIVCAIRHGRTSHMHHVHMVHIGFRALFPIVQWCQCAPERSGASCMQGPRSGTDEI